MVARQVYYGRDRLLWNCALSRAGAFQGYGSCPFTPDLRAELERFPKGDALACGSQIAQQAPYRYGAILSGNGGVVELASFPGPPGTSVALPNMGEEYKLTIVRRDSRLEVGSIQKLAAGTTASPEELTTGC